MPRVAVRDDLARHRLRLVAESAANRRQLVLRAKAHDVPMIETFRGVAPFLVADAARVVLLMLVPAVALVALRL